MPQYLGEPADEPHIYLADYTAHDETNSKVIDAKNKYVAKIFNTRANAWTYVITSNLQTLNNLITQNKTKTMTSTSSEFVRYRQGLNPKLTYKVTKWIRKSGAPKTITRQTAPVAKEEPTTCGLVLGLVLIAITFMSLYLLL